MIIKGIECKRAPHLGFRNSDPARDVDIYGEPHLTNHAVIVRLKDCRVHEEDGRKYYDASEAAAIPTASGSTSYAYGRTRHRAESAVVRESNGALRRVSEYWTTPFYAVRDGKVYRGTIHHYDGPPPAYDLQVSNTASGAAGSR